MSLAGAGGWVPRTQQRRPSERGRLGKLHKLGPFSNESVFVHLLARNDRLR